MEQNWISIIDYARKYNVSDMTVRRRIKTGRIASELRDGKYFIPDARPERELELEEPQTEKIWQKELVHSRPKSMPQSIPDWAPMMASETLNAIHKTQDSQPLEAAIQKLVDTEKHLHAMFESKAQVYEERIQKLELLLNQKDQSIRELSQQLEDLTLLVGIIEKKLPARSVNS